MTDDQLMLYLYKDVGLLWEKELSKDESREKCSMTTNRGLWTFFHINQRVSYTASSARGLDEKTLPAENSFIFTNSQTSIVKSLMQHIRNSIMHGNYQIKRRNDSIYIVFNDSTKDLVTMKGQIHLQTLKDLINTIKSYKPA